MSFAARKNTRMLVIGITGPTGAGKTTLLREVEQLGGTVIDCDGVYHELLKSDTALQNSLEEAFGPLRDASGHIDRKKLGAVVFHDPDKLERLNAIAWQRVTGRVCAVLEECRRQGGALAAVDAIALLESPLHELCQLTVAVLAPPQVRVRRIMTRENIPEEYAWSRVRAQKPDAYFIRGCDHTLINDCPTPEEFGRQARALLEQVQKNYERGSF